MRQTNSAMARELVRFRMPLILSGILKQLYSWADAFIVGHSGPEGERMLAAVGVTGDALTAGRRFCYRRHRKQQSRPDAAVSASSSEK